MIFALVVASVLIGEAYVYTQDGGRYSSDVWKNGNALDYSVTSKGSECYSVVVSDNGTFGEIENYYIYYDESYGSKLESVPVPVGAKPLTQEYYISQLIKTLNTRGVDNIEVLDAEGVRDMCNSGAESAKGLVVLSGALPDTVYSDSVGIIITWINNGGSLYWAGNLLGAYYSSAGGTVNEVTTRLYEQDFFGQPCLNKGDENADLSDITSNDYRDHLSLMNNRIRYGVDTSVITVDSLAVGYTDGKYASIAMVEHGSGMICVLAGDYSNNQRHDLAQIIASGICFGSEEVGYAAGEIKRNTVTGTIEIDGGAGSVPGNNYTAYVYCGGYYTVYGRTEGWKE